MPQIRHCIAAGAALVLFGADPAGAQTSDGEDRQAYSCVVEPSLTVKVGAPVVGLLDETSVVRGSIVRKGQVVARMRDDLERANLAVGEARTANSAEVDAEKARLALARNQLRRAETLAEKGVVPAERIDELRAEVEVGRQNVRREELERELAALERDRAEVVLEQRSIRSPTDGVVTERLLSAGEYVHQEAYVFEIARLDPLHVETFLPVEQYGRVQVGDTAVVRMQDPIGDERIATVDVVDKVLDAASSTFGVRLTLPNADLSLPAGIRCDVMF